MESTLLLVARQRVCHQSTQLPKHPADWPATMWSPARSTFLWKTCHKSYLGRIWQFWWIMHGSTSAFLQDNTCSSTAARTQAAEWRYKSHNVTRFFFKHRTPSRKFAKRYQCTGARFNPSENLLASQLWTVPLNREAHMRSFTGPTFLNKMYFFIIWGNTSQIRKLMFLGPKSNSLVTESGGVFFRCFKHFLSIFYHQPHISAIYII